MSQPASAPPPPARQAAVVAAAPAPPLPTTPAPVPAPPRLAGGARPAYPTAAAVRGTASVGTWVRGKASGVPGQMRVLGALAAAAAVLFGVVGAWNLWSSAQSLGRAGVNTEQVVRIQSIYADVLRADADATNAFLVGGLEDPAQRADYEASVRRASAAITEAASAQPADRAALAALNSALQDYTSLVEQARAYNRQGLPVGNTYMTSASASLRASAVPPLEALLQANTARARGELGASGSAWPTVVTGLLAMATFALVGLWLARRTRRYLNVGLSAGALAVLAALVAAFVVFAGIGSDARRVTDNQLAGTLALTSSRTAAFDARANESLGLIRRGQASANENAWKARDVEVTGRLSALGEVSWFGGSGTSRDLSGAWTAYQKAHAEVRKLDDAGTWEAAVTKATAPGETPRTTFAAFEKSSAAAVEGFQSALVNDVQGPAGRAQVTALILLLAGLAAAVLATRGIAKRVEEYR